MALLLLAACSGGGTPSETPEPQTGGTTNGTTAPPETGPPDYEGQDLTGADFAGQDLTEANFAGATVEGADFTGAVLIRASFANVDAHGAVFAGANLASAKLPQADLSDADLSEANLSVASLRGADLRGADLSGASLSRATLHGAKLADAILTEATLDRTDLVGASGVTDEMLADALNVPVAGVPGALAARETYLDTLVRREKAVAGVCETGRGLPEVRPYTGGPGYHPIQMILDLDDGFGLGSAYGFPRWDPRWDPVALRYAELGGCVKHRSARIESCGRYYSGEESIEVFRVRKDLVVRIVTVHDGRLVDEQVWMGGDPPDCPQESYYDEISGTYPRGGPAKRFVGSFVGPLPTA